MTVRLSLSDCEAALHAHLYGDDVSFAGVGIDTRTLVRGNLYVAIRGERFDGHDFVAQAQDCGATALLVDRRVDSTLPQLVVPDTVAALGALARLWLARHGVPVIAITGSNGKTTTKEIVAAILGQLGPVLATRGNLNNDIGVPLTLFGLDATHRYAVIEMGASHAGDIARLVSIAAPDVAVVTGTGAAHLEGFGSLEGVAHAKAEIFDGLAPQGHAVYNVDDARVSILQASADAHNTRTFGVSASADVRGVAGSGLQIESLGQTLRAEFGLLGDHNGMNALAAVAAVQCLDVQTDAILAGLAAVRAAPGRLQPRRTAGGLTVIDDTYNANPVSVRAATEWLARRSGRRHLVLGDMLELGDGAVAAHVDAGRLAKRLGIDRLWTLGELAQHAAVAFGNGAASHASLDALLDAIGGELDSTDCVLVKGSRGARMERVVEALLAVEPVGRSAGAAATRAEVSLMQGRPKGRSDDRARSA